MMRVRADLTSVAAPDVTGGREGDLLSTAQRHASMRVPVTSASDRVTEVLDRLMGNEYDSASVAAVCDGDLLVGLVTIERLLSAGASAVVGDVMDPNPPTVSPDTHQEHVAWKAVQHGEPGIAVVDDRGRFHGLISPQTLLAVLLEEHDEDMARLGGSLGSASEARSASTERVGRRLLHRLPWLLVGLVGALVAAVIVGGFAEQLEEQVLIAYFVPGVVYIAAAVGMQTETLVIRGMSLGVGIRRVAAREIITGGLLGMILASLAFPLVWAGWGDIEVAAAVGVAMFAASAIATFVAMLLPWTLHRLGKDPAFGSGPIATVIQDLMTVSIYFLTAVAIAS
jgi:magnesium transporter